jgi:hypothetical protein
MEVILMAAQIPPLMIQKISLVTVFDEAQDEKHPIVLLQVGRQSNLIKWLDSEEDLAFGQVSAAQQSRDSESIQLTIGFELEEKTKNYRLRIPFSWVRTASLLSSHSGFPMFMIAPEDVDYSSTTVYSLMEFDAMVLPIGDEEVDNTLDSLISEHITGSPDLRLTFDEFNSARTEVMEIIIGLIHGDNKALLSAYSYVNSYNEFSHDSKKNGWQPKAEQKKLAYIKTQLLSLLSKTNPAAISSELMNSENIEEHVADISTFEELMRENGLDRMFDEALPEAKSPGGNSPQEQVAYLARPITTLPRSMASLEKKLKTLPAIDKPWQTSPETDLISTGDDLAAAFVVVATRLARLEELQLEDEGRIYPMVVLGHGLAVQGEEGPWILRESMRLLAVDKTLPLTDFLMNGTGNLNPQELTNTVLGFLFHRFGHKILEEKWERNIIKIALRNQPLMAEFVDEVYEQAAQERPGDLGDDEAPCSVIAASFNFFRLGFDKDSMVKELIGAMLSVADLNAHKETEFIKDSPDWQQYLEDYLVSLVEDTE